METCNVLNSRSLLAAAVSATLLASAPAMAEDSGRSFEIYGFAQADAIQDFKRVNPNWKDTLRPSRIPTQQGQYGEDG